MQLSHRDSVDRSVSLNSCKKPLRSESETSFRQKKPLVIFFDVLMLKLHPSLLKNLCSCVIQDHIFSSNLFCSWFFSFFVIIRHCFFEGQLVIAINRRRASSTERLEALSNGALARWACRGDELRKRGNDRLTCKRAPSYVTFAVDFARCSLVFLVSVNQRVNGGRPPRRELRRIMRSSKIPNATTVGCLCNLLFVHKRAEKN